MLSNIDIAPTLAQIGGATLQGADGTSFLRAAPRSSHSRAIDHPRAPDHAHTTPRIFWSAIRTRSWHFIRWSNGRRELYLLTTDPWELKNRTSLEESRHGAGARDQARRAPIERSRS